MNDAVIRRRLFVALVCYEVAIVSVILAAGANIALTQGGTLAGAAPLVVIGLAESQRIFLAGWSTRLRFGGKVLAWLALIAIGLASFDGLALVFSIFVDNRLTNVLQAQHQVEIAQHAADANASDTAAFVAEVKEVDEEITALAASRPTPPPASNKTCTWKGQESRAGLTRRPLLPMPPLRRLMTPASLTSKRNAPPHRLRSTAPEAARPPPKSSPKRAGNSTTN